MSDEPKHDHPQKAEPQVIDGDIIELKAEAEAPRQDDEAFSPGNTEADGGHHAPRDEVFTPPPATAARKAEGRGPMGWIVAALAFGLLAGGWLYRDVISAYLPTSEMQALRDRVDVIESNGKVFGEQIGAISQMANEAQQGATDAGTAAKAAADAVQAAGSRLDGQDARITELDASLKSASDELRALRDAIATGAASSGGTVDNAALAALSQRLDALEKDLASLKASGGGSETAALTAALSQTLSDLKAKIGTGASFQAEYDRIARMVPAAQGLDVLAAHAAAGLPNAPGLAAELTALADTLPRPETPAPEDDGSYWDSFLGLVSGIVTVRDIGETDWPALARKAADLAAGGDLAAAIALIGDAEGSKPPSLLQWHDRAAARLQLEAALALVSEATIRQIAAIGGAQ